MVSIWRRSGAHCRNSWQKILSDPPQPSGLSQQYLSLEQYWILLSYLHPRAILGLKRDSESHWTFHQPSPTSAEDLSRIPQGVSSLREIGQAPGHSAWLNMRCVPQQLQSPQNRGPQIHPCNPREALSAVPWLDLLPRLCPTQP